MKKTCLHGCHTELEAKMAPFAGYDMPIEYTGLDEEHKAVRTRAGLFDVSHMGEIYVGGPDAAAFVDHIFTNYAAAMADGQVLYGMMTNENGGTVDDCSYTASASRNSCSWLTRRTSTRTSSG